MKKSIFFTLTLTLLLTFLTVLPTCGASPEGQSDMQTPVYLGEIELGGDAEIVPYESDSGVQAFSLATPPDWLKDGSRNYYNYMGTLEKGVAYQGIYNKLYAACESFAYDPYSPLFHLVEDDLDLYLLCVDITEYVVPYDITGPEAFHAYLQMLHDNPQIFFTDNSAACAPHGNRYYMMMSIAPEYINGEDRIAEADAITQGIEGYDAIINKNMSAYAIEKKVHDKLILDNAYSYDENGVPNDAKYAHSIAGSLNAEYGGGVCESYAKTTQLLLNRYDVDNYYIVGTVPTGDGSSAGHGWNMVQLDNGGYYCIDCTWDDGNVMDTEGNLYSTLSYRFFNMPYDSFYGGTRYNNEAELYVEALPEGNNDTTYYTSNLNEYTIVGNVVYYKAPDVSEDETRITTTEATTEATTQAPIQTTEPAPEATTGELQTYLTNISCSMVLGSTGSWSEWTDSDGTAGVRLQSSSDNSELYITGTNSSPTYINYQLYPNKTDGSYSAYVYVDDVLTNTYSYTAGEAREASHGIISLDAGQHTVRWVFDTASSYLIYDLKATSKYDVTGDNTVNILDASELVRLFRTDSYVELNNTLAYDINCDNKLNHRDLVELLKAIAGIN